MEKAQLGGTYINMGCVPKKVMLNATYIAKTLHNMHHYGSCCPRTTSPLTGPLEAVLQCICPEIERHLQTEPTDCLCPKDHWHCRATKGIKYHHCARTTRWIT